MFIHDKKVIINIFHMKKLDFGKIGLSNSKNPPYLGNLDYLNTLKGVSILVLSSTGTTESLGESRGRGGAGHLVTAWLPRVHNPAENQVIPVIKLIYNTSNTRVVLKGTRQY